MNYIDQMRNDKNELIKAIALCVKIKEIVNKINASDEGVVISGDKISLAGKTIDLTSEIIEIISTNFNVDKDGNVTMHDATIYGDIYLPNSSTKVIGEFGILQTLDYDGKNEGFESPQIVVPGAFFLGYNTDKSTNWANFMSFDVYIPQNFVPVDARIILVHTPVKWDNGADYNLWGWCRNLKAYNITNANNLLLSAAFLGEYNQVGTPTFSEISNVFGASGYTPTTPNDTTHLTETTISADIKSSLTAGIDNRIAIKTSDAIPTFNASLATNCANLGAKTGYVRGMVVVIGYNKV
jgi:hypothetical protein